MEEEEAEALSFLLPLSSPAAGGGGNGDGTMEEEEEEQRRDQEEGRPPQRPFKVEGEEEDSFPQSHYFFVGERLRGICLYISHPASPRRTSPAPGSSRSAQ